MNQHLTPADFKQSLATDTTLFNVEMDVSDIVSLLDKVDYFVSGMALDDEDLRMEQEGIASLIRATTAVAARALAALEAYRGAHP